MAKHSRPFSFKLAQVKLPVLLITLTVLVAVVGIVLAIVLLQKQPAQSDSASSVWSASSAVTSTQSQTGANVSWPVISNGGSSQPYSSAYSIQSYVPEKKIINVEKGDELVFQQGGAATVRIRAVAYTVYTLEIRPVGRQPITVGSKRTDGNGNAVWNWTLDPALGGGEYPFVIYSEQDREEFYVWIEDQ